MSSLPTKPPEDSQSPTQDFPISDIKVGDFIDKVTVKKGESAFYKLVITDTIYKDDDLVIKVVPLDQDSDPDIFISQTEKYPQNSLTSDWQC
jgi:hypothetical protein